MRTLLISFSVLALGLAVGCGSDSGGGDGDDDPGGGDGEVDGGSGSSTDTPPPFENCAGGDASDDQFDGDSGLDPDAGPIAVFEHEFVDWMGTPAVHIRLTFNPSFTDNTYGANSVGWGNKGRGFDKVVGSDHARILVVDSTGQLAFDVQLDLLVADSNSPCGFASGGFSDGDGNLFVGDPAAILYWTTSMDQNLNERGYCLLEDSPVSDENCTPDPNYPDWDFRVTYDVWIAVSAFDPNSFGSAHLDSVHASPAKTPSDTILVEPVECPDDLCTDPDGCDNGPGGTCQDVGECAADEFCYEGTCLPIVQ